MKHIAAGLSGAKDWRRSKGREIETSWSVATCSCNWSVSRVALQVANRNEQRTPYDVPRRFEVFNRVSAGPHSLQRDLLSARIS